MRTLFHVRRNRRGTSSLEFALMLPLVMIFFIGIIQFSFFFFVDQSLQTFVTYAARSAVIEAQANSSSVFSATSPGTSIPYTASSSCTTNCFGFGSLLPVTPFLDPKQLTLNISESATSGITTVTATATYPWRLPLPATTGTLSQSSSFSFAN